MEGVEEDRSADAEAMEVVHSLRRYRTVEGGRHMLVEGIHNHIERGEEARQEEEPEYGQIQFDCMPSPASSRTDGRDWEEVEGAHR